MPPIYVTVFFSRFHFIIIITVIIIIVIIIIIILKINNSTITAKLANALLSFDTRSI